MGNEFRGKNTFFLAFDAFFILHFYLIKGINQSCDQGKGCFCDYRAFVV
jgi:hypothetical protein